MMTGCGEPALGDAGSGPGEEPVSSLQQEFGSPLVSDRFIPLRFVQMTQYDGQPDFVSFDAMRKRVQEANWTFKDAGVRFYIAKWEKIAMPRFNSIDAFEVARPWYTERGLDFSVRNDLRALFPSLPTNAYNDNDLLNEDRWLASAAAKAADRSEILILVAGTTANGYWGGNPHWDASVIRIDPNITTAFTHELGHLLGLEHTHSGTSWNPETNQPSKKADYWDLMYVPPATTFSSRGDAWPYENQLVRKNNNDAPSNPCSTDGSCTVGCTISGNSYQHGDPMLYGLAFTFAGDTPGTPRRGFNVMGYYGNNCATNGNNGMGISGSQAAQIRRSLRWDTRIDAPYQLIYPYQNYFSGRPYLGDWRGRPSVTASLLEKLKLDSDSKRDFGVWQPPLNPQDLGTFTFVLSTTGYDVNQPLVRPFGQMGDVPVLADYDCDGRTDIAVFHSGGATGSDPYSSAGFWRYCTSSSNYDCANIPTPIYFGQRGDLPLPATNFDGDPNTCELAFYRPSTGNWYWRTVGSTTVHVIYGDGATDANERVQLPGLYDDDEKTDIVYYRPRAGSFSMLLSSSNWSQASRIDRVFPPNAVPFYGGFYDGSGAIIMRRAQATRTICNPLCFPRPRRVLQLWEEGSGNWQTMWNPVTSATVSTCQWGNPLDTPLSGFIDVDSDGKSDYVTWRHSTSDQGGAFYVKSSADGTCSGSTFSRTPGSAPPPGTVVLPVWDMSGDGKDELMMVHPHTLVWQWLNSSTYSSGASVQLGVSGAVPL
jgi:hypothetical protein